VDDVEPKENGLSQKVKVKIRVNLHGVFAVTSAYLVETREVEEEVPMDADPAAKPAKTRLSFVPSSRQFLLKEVLMDDGGFQLKKKTVTKNIELPVVSKAVGALSRESLETLAGIEMSLTSQDATEAERLNTNNTVEEYIYDIRDKDYSTSTPVDEKSRCNKEADFSIVLLDDGQYCAELHVASMFYPEINGKNGYVKKGLENDSKTRIDIPKKGFEDEPVVILGKTRVNVQAACSQLVDRLVESSCRQTASLIHLRQKISRQDCKFHEKTEESSRIAQ